MAKKSDGKKRSGCGKWIVVAIIIVLIGTALSSNKPSAQSTDVPAGSKSAPIPISTATEKPQPVVATRPPKVVDITVVPAKPQAPVATDRPRPTLRLEPVAPVADVPTLAPESNCEAAYPDFCIPVGSPDLDCKDVAPHKRFTVLPPDPHQFDKDGNGIGCES